MKLGFKEDFIKIYQTERGILILMILNLLLSIGLLIFSLINLNPNRLAFPLLAIIFGVFHNLLALRIFHKRGGGMTKFFLIITTALIAGTALVLIRLLGEG